jgi:hypothetical protein
MFNRHAYLVKPDGSFVATLVRADETNEAFAARVERPDLTVTWERPPSQVVARKSAPFPGVNRKRRRR